MPELVDFVPWENVSWDNMSKDSNSGGGAIDERTYFYRIIISNGAKKLLIISAVPSKMQPGNYHAVDYLRLSKDSFDKLTQVGRNIW